MASRRGKDDRPKMIHCEYCGEDYSSTYKHCPFCDEVEQQDYDDQEEYEDSAPRSRGGKRLVTNTRGGGHYCYHHHHAPGKQGPYRARLLGPTGELRPRYGRI